MKTHTKKYAAAPAIEVRATSRHPLGMPVRDFLRAYWQKRPVLIRGMFAGDVNALTPNDLAGLACEETALARIVVRDVERDRWTPRSGPFRATDFAKLGQRNWTLLVQDVDKWDMDVAALLDLFTFIPTWRIDDVMVSYATDGGGVGPHIDQYDVFLIQGMGYRRWSIDARPRELIPDAFRDDSELMLLREFTPTHTWLLDPGDTLYLPPGVPHDGVALGECTSYSVGIRAPSRAELLFDFTEFLAEPLTENERYIDPDLAPARATGEIDAAALARVRKALPHFTHVDESVLASWFGRFITRYRSAQAAAAPGRAPSVAQLRQRLPSSTVLRNPFSRFAWRHAEKQAELFVAGEAFACPLPFAKRLCASREIDGAALVAMLRDTAAWQTLCALFASGHLRAQGRGTRG
jgi:50S ribosomal protein L16 3-hydroxylase